VEALRIGGEDLPAQSVGAFQRTARMDVPALGASGRGLIMVTWIVTPAEPNGTPTFTLVDAFPRHIALPDGPED
jgi:hypothetical protein